MDPSPATWSVWPEVLVVNITVLLCISFVAAFSGWDLCRARLASNSESHGLAFFKPQATTPQLLFIEIWTQKAAFFRTIRANI